MDIKGVNKIENLFILTKFIKGKIIDTEYFVRRYFKDKGYNVYVSSKINGKNISEIFLSNGFKFNSNLKKLRDVILKERMGIPDLFLIKEDKIFFVEIKSNNDGLRINQLRWMQKNPEFKKIIFCVKKR